MNAKETAHQLIKDNFPASKYRALQAEREKRLEFFKERKIDVLIYHAASLVKFGKKVLRILEEHEIMTLLKNHKFKA